MHTVTLIFVRGGGRSTIKHCSPRPAEQWLRLRLRSSASWDGACGCDLAQRLTLGRQASHD